MCPICLNNSPNPVSSPLFHYFHCGSWQIIIPFLKLLSQASVTLLSPGSYPTGAQYFCSLFFHQSWDVNTPILSSQPSLFLPLNSLPLALLLLKLFPLCEWLPNNYLKPWHLSRPLSLMRSSQAAVKINKKKVSKRVACMQVGTLSLPQVSCWRWWGHSKEWSFNFKHQVFHAGDWDDAGLRPPPVVCSAAFTIWQRGLELERLCPTHTARTFSSPSLWCFAWAQGRLLGPPFPVPPGSWLLQWPRTLQMLLPQCSACSLLDSNSAPHLGICVPGLPLENGSRPLFMGTSPCKPHHTTSL